MRAIWRADYFKSEMWVSSWGVQAAVGVYFGAWREWLGHTPKSVTVNNEPTYEMAYSVVTAENVLRLCLHTLYW